MIKIGKKVENDGCGVAHYNLTINYMIGDADGYTEEYAWLSEDNVYLEKVLRILDKLKPTKGSWGISFDADRIQKQWKEGNITEEEYKFFIALAYTAGDGEIITNEDSYDEFEEAAPLFYAETEYSYVTFEGYELTYTDKFGVEYEAKLE